VEKEVVLLDQNVEEKLSDRNALDMASSEKAQDATASGDMVVDADVSPPVDCTHMTASMNGHRVLKVIRKVEVQVLCTQHNPVRRHLLFIFEFDLMLLR
jgi:hypothetical protein